MAVYTTIDNPKEYFSVNTWTADDSSPRSFTGFGHQPDLLWVKHRNSGAINPTIVDSVRGGDKMLASATNAVEDTKSHGEVTAFGSDGITVADGTSGSYPKLYFNDLNPFGASVGGEYIGWSWKMANSTASNSNGGITSTVSVNSTSKCSIISWSGSGTNTTVGHGLGVKPKIIFVKNRQRESAWVVNVGEAVGADERSMYLHDASAMKSDAASAGGYTYNNTTSLFSIVAGSSGNSNDINASGEGIIAYAFGDVQGYCKISTYIGNGESSNGSFVYCGFKPAWVMIKGTADNLSWTIYDNKRGYNSDNAYLLADGSDTQLSDKDIDLLSTGFRPRTNNGALNSDGNTYLFMAFAEAPFVNSKGVPNNAR